MNPLTRRSTARLLLPVAVLMLRITPGFAQCDIREEQTLTPPGADHSDFFGSAIDSDGERIVLGGPGYDRSGGAADIFVSGEDGWVFEARLVATSIATDAEFGAAVAISGDVALVGAPGDEVDGVAGGSAFVFRRDIVTGVWQQETRLVASAIELSANFGAAVAWVEDRAIVGAWTEDTDAGANSGAVHVFRRVAGTWVEETTLVPADADATDLFGYSLDADGSRFIAGSLLADSDAPDTGAATVFRLDGDTWIEEMTLTPAGVASGARFGFDVAIDAGRAALVSRQYAATQVFTRSGTSWSWSATQDDFAAVPESVALSGPYLLVGVPASQWVRLFVNEGNAWIDRGVLRPFAASPLLGVSVAAASPLVMGGAPLAEIDGSDGGGGFVFRLDAPDCDGDGLNDGCSVDCNNNRVPDSCDIDPADPDGDGIVYDDCDENGVPDVCDPDCGDNGIPDACEADCNRNGVPDDCDPDCNDNGVPDDCDVDPVDPDGDGVVWPDCDGNGVPDVCDPDCDGNGLPDACEPDDCNDNGVPDACELPGTDGLPTIIPGPAGATVFGKSLALDGDRLIVGSSLGGTNAHARIFFYERAGTVWIPDGTFNVDEDHGGSLPVTIDGNFAMVGLSRNNQVLVFERDGTWTQVDVIELDPPVVNAQFGRNVDLCGDRLLIDAPGVTSELYLYRHDPDTSEWVVEDSFPSESGFAGFDVALADDMVFVGDPALSKIRIFAPGPEAVDWTERPSVQADVPFFGAQFSTDGDRLVAVVPGGEETEADAILVYGAAGCDTWALETVIELELGDGGFGPVAVDGNTIAAALRPTDDMPDLTQVVLLQRDPADGTWSTTREVTVPNYEWNDVTVVLDAGRLAVGATDPAEVSIHGFATDCNGNGVPDDCESPGYPAECLPPPCPGDIIGDRRVAVLDLVAVITAWGCDDSPADVTGDGRVDVNDLVAVIEGWGDCD